MSAAGPGRILTRPCRNVAQRWYNTAAPSTLPEHLRRLSERLPFQALVTGAGKRLRRDEVWSHGLRADMPRHYKAYYNLWRQGPQQHIHSRPNTHNFEKDEWGEIHPVQNPRVYVIYPEQFHEGLWGGEGVVKGMLARKDGNHRNFTPPAAKYWWPTLLEGVVYSEILDKHIELLMTKRGVRLVDEAAGFDSYLLSTPVNEVYATGLLRLKRELLLALALPDRLPGSVLQKYEEFRLPHHEADWHGLTMAQARAKQADINARREAAARIPDKVVFRRQLVEELRSGRLQEEEAELVGEPTTEDGGILGGIKSVFGKK